MYATDLDDVWRQWPRRFGNEMSVGENHRRFDQVQSVVLPRVSEPVLPFGIPRQRRTEDCQHYVGKTL